MLQPWFIFIKHRKFFFEDFKYVIYVRVASLYN